MQLTIKEMTYVVLALKAWRNKLKSEAWELGDSIYGKQDDKNGTHLAQEFKEKYLSESKQYQELSALIEKIEKSGVKIEVENGKDRI